MRSWLLIMSQAAHLSVPRQACAAAAGDRGEATSRGTDSCAVQPSSCAPTEGGGGQARVQDIDNNSEVPSPSGGQDSLGQGHCAAFCAQLGCRRLRRRRKRRRRVGRVRAREGTTRPRWRGTLFSGSYVVHRRAGSLRWSPATTFWSIKHTSRRLTGVTSTRYALLLAASAGACRCCTAGGGETTQPTLSNLEPLPWRPLFVCSGRSQR